MGVEKTHFVRLWWIDLLRSFRSKICLGVGRAVAGTGMLPDTKKRIKMKRLIITTCLYVLVVLVLPALAVPVDVYSVDGPQDPLFLEGRVEEFGDMFPPNERIKSKWWFTKLTACTEEPYDNPRIPNVMVQIVNLTTKTVPLWYVGDTHFSPTGGGLIYDTTFTNRDGFIGNAGLNDAGMAFKIDHVGVNQPLVFESKGWNNLFEPGEIWRFIIQDYANIFWGPPAPFGSYDWINNVGRIASLSGGVPHCCGVSLCCCVPPLTSTGSLVTPEPATICLLGLGGLLLGRNRKFNKK
jgi:hypothetical protein